VVHAIPSETDWIIPTNVVHAIPPTQEYPEDMSTPPTQEYPEDMSTFVGAQPLSGAPAPSRSKLNLELERGLYHLCVSDWWSERVPVCLRPGFTRPCSFGLVDPRVAIHQYTRDQRRASPTEHRFRSHLGSSYSVSYPYPYSLLPVARGRLSSRDLLGLRFTRAMLGIRAAAMWFLFLVFLLGRWAAAMSLGFWRDTTQDDVCLNSLRFYTNFSLAIGGATLLALGLVQIGKVEIKIKIRWAPPPPRGSTGAVEQESQTATRHTSLSGIIGMQHITVDGLRLLWTHLQLGPTKNVLRGDLESGAALAMVRRHIELTMMTCDRDRID
jgi:hypothetical protein